MLACVQAQAPRQYLPYLCTRCRLRWPSLRRYSATDPKSRTSLKTNSGTIRSTSKNPSFEQLIEHDIRNTHLFGQEDDGKDDESRNSSVGAHHRQKKVHNRTGVDVNGQGLENGDLQEDSIRAASSEETLEPTLSEKKANKSRKTAQHGDLQYGGHLETSQSQTPRRQTATNSATSFNNSHLSLKEALMTLDEAGTETRTSKASNRTKKATRSKDSKVAMVDGVSATDFRITCESLFQTL